MCLQNYVGKLENVQQTATKKLRLEKPFCYESRQLSSV